MGILARVAQIALANLNDLIDQAENPEHLANQWPREMAWNLQHVRESLTEMLTQEKILESDWADYVRRSARWNAIATRAVQVGRDDLALESLRRKHMDEAIASAYEGQLADQRLAVAQARSQLNALVLNHQQALAKRNLLIARLRIARSQEAVARCLWSQTTPTVESMFTQLERRVRSAEARAWAVASVASVDSGEGLQQLAIEVDLDGALAWLKAMWDSQANIQQRSS